MVSSFAISGILLLVLQVFTGVDSLTVDAKIRDDPDLSQFYQLLEASHVANTTMMYRHVTVFAPTNLAFQKSRAPSEDIKDLVLYHMSNLPKTADDLRDSISSELEGNPPLWVTRKRINYNEEIYINNAKIIEGRSFKSTMKQQSGDVKNQVLHIINEVLEPVVSIATADPIYNPNAFEFLNKSDNINLGDMRVRTFRQRMMLNKKEDVFKADGRYTFFIPIDEGFKPNLRPHKVDSQVIDGHIIPGHVLFTAPTPRDKAYNTLAFSDNLKVTVSFVAQQDKIYVKSNTLAGPPNYPTGAVMAEILKANIPVQNGVVHLIQRPLMVVDTTVQQFLEDIDKEDGPVYKLYEVIKDLGDGFMQTLTNQRSITLFAPSNAAWEEEGVRHILQDKEHLREILNLHYVKDKLPLDVIKQKSVNQMPSDGRGQFGVQTAANWKSLYFNVITGPNGSQTVTVEGGGVNATVITANIAATNGIIHIIDRVLGVPYTTVLDKLRTDPMLNSTYYLGTQRDFNNQLNDTKKRFTYFVPRDSAWEIARISIPSTYKKLFMPQFNYHTQQILERHLVVANQPYTMAQLKKMVVNGTVTLQAVRGSLKLRIREADDILLQPDEKYDENAIRPRDYFGYQIEWMGKWIRVYRPDVPCTNGIIHVIDEAFVSPDDVQVTGGASMTSVATHLIILVIAKWFL
ncbi:fasciclin-1 isoform X3 [Venturia canescens]|uniref:fasciclin-1 isoform X3 n=1 Tax=Venturia canescens TaxID=32260 RepID=UPI001C9C7DCB|nr:fasciclin-1 isoform X3 [Venturia canescens]